MNQNIHKKWVPNGLSNHPSRLMPSINYVTIHTTGNRNPTATAEAHARFQFSGGGGRQASWHYTVDADDIWQSFKDQQMCWHTGTLIGNETSIGIEICINSQESFRAACDKTAWLTAVLLKRHGLGIDQVVQHHKWNGKNCPAELRSHTWDVSWNEFLLMIGRISKNLTEHALSAEDTEAAVNALKNASILFEENYWRSVFKGTIDLNRKWTKILVNRIIDSRWIYFTPKMVGSVLLTMLGKRE